jgi:hypothetical protein
MPNNCRSHIHRTPSMERDDACTLTPQPRDAGIGEASGNRRLFPHLRALEAT